MENVRYSVKRLAEIVGATPRQVDGALGKRDAYGPEVLAELREKLKKPAPAPVRRRASSSSSTSRAAPARPALSSSYAYRLAERGYRVLVVDLDSQGHATKCLGHEGGDATGHPLRRAGPQDAHRRGDASAPACRASTLVPANLAMSTIDLSLMPMAGREFRLAQGARGGAAPATTSWCSTRRPPSACST